MYLKQIEEKKAEIVDKTNKLQAVIDKESAKKAEQQAKVNEVKTEEEKYEQIQLAIAGSLAEYEKKLKATEAEENAIRAEIARIAAASSQSSASAPAAPAPIRASVASAVATLPATSEMFG